MSFEELLTRWNKGVTHRAQTRLADVLGVKPNTVSQWKTGAGMPGQEMLEKVAEVFGVSVQDVRLSLPGTAIREGKIPHTASIDPLFPGAIAVSFIPVHGIVSATGFNMSEDDPYPERIAAPFSCGKCFAIKVSGDCMEPAFSDGEYVVIDPERPATEGRVVLALLDGELTLKRIHIGKDHVELRPDNPKHKTIKVASNKVSVRGVVVWSCRKF